MTMPLEERVGLHLKRAEQELMAAKSTALRPLGLTVPQYSALLLLARNPGMSAAALARGCLVTPQTMATVLANLESKGLVSRQPHRWHRSVTELQLTDEGQRLLVRADAEASAIEQGIAAEFSTTEQAQLIAMLERVSRHLQGQRDDKPTVGS